MATSSRTTKKTFFRNNFKSNIVTLSKIECVMILVSGSWNNWAVTQMSFLAKVQEIRKIYAAFQFHFKHEIDIFVNGEKKKLKKINAEHFFFSKSKKSRNIKFGGTWHLKKIFAFLQSWNPFPFFGNISLPFFTPLSLFLSPFSLPFSLSLLSHSLSRPICKVDLMPPSDLIQVRALVIYHVSWSQHITF